MEERLKRMFLPPGTLILDSISYSVPYSGKTLISEKDVIGNKDDNFVLFPHFTPSKIKKKGASMIPKQIFQTWKTRYIKKDIEKYMRKLIEKNPEYDYYLFGDYECQEYLKRYFTSDYLDAFNDLIPGAFKADFWRYAILYREGGVYIDLDLEILYPLDSILPKDAEFISIKDRCPSYYNNGIFQAFIATIPKHEFLSCSLQLCLSNIQSGYIHPRSSLGMTGPLMMGIAMNGALNRDLESSFENGDFSFTRNSSKSLFTLFLFVDDVDETRDHNNVTIINTRISEYVPVSSYGSMYNQGKIYKSFPSYGEQTEGLRWLIIVLSVIILILVFGLKMKNGNGNRRK